MFDKPGAPVGILKFQFDPLPTHCQELYLKLPQARAEYTELAVRQSACAHLRISWLGVLLYWKARGISERGRAST
jgi:hypothetical protein